MAKVLRHLLQVLTLCIFIPTVLTDATSDRYRSPAQNKVPRKSWTYFDQISKASKVVQQLKLLENQDVRGEFEKVSQDLFSSFFPARTAGSLLQSHAQVVGSGSTDGVMVVDVQKVLMSTLEALAEDGAYSSACVNDTSRLLVAMFEKELWALKFLDAFGKPGPGLSQYRFNLVGDYDLCQQQQSSATQSRNMSSFGGSYCVLKAGFGPPSARGLLDLNIGACVPDTCSDDEITLFVTEVLQRLDLNGTLQPEDAECHTDDREMTSATVVAITLVAIIVLLMVAGTFYDIIFIQRPKWLLASMVEEDLLTNGVRPEGYRYGAIGEDNPGSSSESILLLGGTKVKGTENGHLGVCSKVLLAFSVYSNASKVLNTNQPSGSLGSIHGIRFLSMSWVILGHMFTFGLGEIGNFATELPVLLKRWTFDAVSNAFFSVDTFFTLSGFLTAYITLGEMKKRGWKINWLLFYFHRYWRLTPPYMLTLLTVLGFQQYLGSGALWPQVQPADKDNCDNYWWANMLYVNNLVDSSKMCFGHSWYLSNDMQFFLLSPLMLIPFYFRPVFGYVSCLIFLLACWITTGALSTHYSWPTTILSAGATSDLALSTWFTDYYIVPWCRIGAYVVGVMAGLYLAHNNGKIRMKWYVSLLGWAVATATGLACVYGLRGDIGGESRSSVGVAAFYNAVSRSAWGACVCWVIIACASGHGGFVNSLLSWSPFVVLGRLTYMSYLIHPCLLFAFFQNLDQLYYISDISIVVTYCGLVVITNMVAFVLMLGFESPMIGLERTFIRKERKD